MTKLSESNVLGGRAGNNTKIILSIESLDTLETVPYLRNYIDGVKINHILWNEIDLVATEGKEIFVDFKLWDTPNTIKTVLNRIIQKGGTMTTISTYNSPEVFEELKEYHDRIKLLGVTYLTSWSPRSQYEITREMPDKMWERAIRRCKGFYGMICSPFDIVDIKYNDIDEDLKTICPGIGHNKGQNRTCSASEASGLHADYIVVGRTVTDSDNPLKTIKEIRKEMDQND